MSIIVLGISIIGLAYVNYKLSQSHLLNCQILVMLTEIIKEMQDEVDTIKEKLEERKSIYKMK